MLQSNQTEPISIDGLPASMMGNLTQNMTFLVPLDYADMGQGAPPVPPMFHPPPPDAMDIILQRTIWALKMYYTPALVVLGIIGNIFSVMIMLRTKLKLLSFVHYLAAILAADTLFLLNLLCLWLVDMGINLYKLGAWCHFTTFLSHSSGFLSLWYTVCLAVDRVIFMHFTLLERKLCTTTRAKILVVALALTAIAVFLNMSLLVEVFQHGATAMCIPVRQYVMILRKLNHVDTFINSIIPYSILLIIFLLGTIKSYREHRWMQGHGRTRNPRQTYECEHERGQTRASFAFLFYFLILTTPLQSFRVTLTLKEMINPMAMSRPNMKLMLWQQVLQYPYYTRFSFNVLILLTCYQGFRLCTKHLLGGAMQSLQSAFTCHSGADNESDGDTPIGPVDEASVALCVIKDSD